MILSPLVGVDSQRPAWLAAMDSIVFLSADMLKTGGRLGLDSARAEFVRVRQWLKARNKWRNPLLFAMDLEPFPKRVGEDEWDGENQPEDYAAILGVAQSVFNRPNHQFAFTGYPGLDLNMALPSWLVGMPNMYPRQGDALKSTQSALKVVRALNAGIVPLVSPWDKKSSDPDTFTWNPECGSAVLDVCRAVGIERAAVWIPGDSKLVNFEGRDPVAETLAWMEAERVK